MCAKSVVEEKKKVWLFLLPAKPSREKRNVRLLSPRLRGLLETGPCAETSYWNSDGGNKAERKGSRRREAKQQAGARDEGDAAFIILSLGKKQAKLYLISWKGGEQTFFFSLYF